MRSEQELSNDAEEKNRHHLRCIRLNSIDDLFLTWRLFFDSFDQTIVAPFCWLRTTAISTQAGSVLPNVVCFDTWTDVCFSQLTIPYV